MGSKNLPLENVTRKKLFKRKSADKVLQNILDKINKVNENKDFIYFIKKAIVFGSYINSDNDRIGDLDIALYLELKDKTIPEENQNCDRFKKAGKGYQPFIIQMLYGKEEIFKFVKDNKRIVELHDGVRAELESRYYDDPYCYIYADKNKVIYEMEGIN